MSRDALTSDQLDTLSEAEGVELREEKLDAVVGGASGEALHSFTCPACGEQVYFYGNDRPFTCPHCDMHV